MGSGKINWDAERDHYVTGTESLSDLAERRGVTKSAVEKHASDRGANGGQTWGEMRVDFRKRVSDETEKEAIAIASRALAEVRQKSINVAKLALEELERRLAPCHEEAAARVLTKDLVQVAKLAAMIEIERTGDPDDEIAQMDRALDAELRRLAGGT